MKKTIAYLLLSIIIYQTVGYVLSFKIMKYSIESEFKTKIKNNLSDKNCSHFNINSISNHSTFRWEEKNHEFWYQGTIYDIVSISKSGIIKCIDDTKESKLFKNLDRFVDGYYTKNVNGKKALQNINSVFFALFLPAKEFAIQPRFVINIKSKCDQIAISKPSNSFAKIAPPPRFL
jgi:hypothetical protein